MRKSQLAIAVAVALSLPTVGYAAGDVVIEQGGSDDHEANVVRNGTNPTSKVKIMQWDAAPQTANVELSGGPDFLAEIFQTGSTDGGQATINLTNVQPTDVKGSIVQGGEANEATIDSSGSGPTSAASTYSITQGEVDKANKILVDPGYFNEATITAVDTSGDDVSVDQRGFSQDADIDIEGVAGTSIVVQQNDANNAVDVDISKGGFIASGTVLNVDQDGTGNNANLDSVGDFESVIKINQDDDANTANVGLEGSRRITVDINQNVEGDGNSATVDAARAYVTDVDVDQQGDDNTALVSIDNDGAGALPAPHSSVDIDQGDTANFATATLRNTEGVDVVVDQSASGDDNTARVFLIGDSPSSLVRNSTATVTQSDNSNAAFVLIEDSEDVAATVTQSGGRNQANAQILDSNGTATVDILQDGRSGFARIKTEQAKGDSDFDIIQGEDTFENNAQIDFEKSSGTVALIDQQTGELNRARIESDRSDFDGNYLITQNDDRNNAAIVSNGSSNLNASISQGLINGDSNFASLVFSESGGPGTNVSVKQDDGNDNVVRAGLFGDRGTTLNVTQADDGNFVGGLGGSGVGRIVASAFEFTINQGVGGGDGNVVGFQINNVNESVVTLNQVDNDNSIFLSMDNDLSSSINVDQSNEGVGHKASVFFAGNTSNIVVDVDQVGGFGNTANVFAEDMNQGSVTIKQLGGFENLATATLADFQDTDALSITQTDCYRCVAVVNDTDAIVVQ